MLDLQKTDKQINEAIKLRLTKENRVKLEILFSQIKIKYLNEINRKGSIPILTCRLKYIKELLAVLDEFDEQDE